MKKDTTDISVLWGKVSGGVAREVTSSIRTVKIDFKRDGLVFSALGSRYRMTLTKIEDGKDES